MRENPTSGAGQAGASLDELHRPACTLSPYDAYNFLTGVKWNNDGLPGQESNFPQRGQRPEVEASIDELRKFYEEPASIERHKRYGFFSALHNEFEGTRQRVMKEVREAAARGELGNLFDVPDNNTYLRDHRDRFVNWLEREMR